MSHIILPCDSGNVSDGYHTFNELYAHRNLLFLTLMRSYPNLSWRAVRDYNGQHEVGFFMAGMHLPTGDVSYHIPEQFWGLLDNCDIATTTVAPPWDGHSSGTVLDRLEDWLRYVTLDPLGRPGPSSSE